MALICPPTLCLCCPTHPTYPAALTSMGWEGFSTGSSTSGFLGFRPDSSSCKNWFQESSVQILSAFSWCLGTYVEGVGMSLNREVRAYWPGINSSLSSHCHTPLPAGSLLRSGTLLAVQGHPTLKGTWPWSTAWPLWGAGGAGYLIFGLEQGGECSRITVEGASRKLLREAPAPPKEREECSSGSF